MSREYILLKGTVRVISSNLPFIEMHNRFTTIPLKPFVDILIYIAGNLVPRNGASVY